MSRTPSTSTAEPQSSSALASRHKRSLSEQSALTPSSSVAPSVNSSYNGPLHGRRPAAGVTTVQKRRFRTQSSTVGQGTRRTATSSTTPATAATTSGDGHAVAMHTRPAAEHKSDKTSNDAAAVVLPNINSGTFQSGVTRTVQASAAPPQKEDGGSSEKPKSTSAGVAAAAAAAATNTTAAAGNEKKAPRDLSASTPSKTNSCNNSASATAAASTSQQSVIKKANPSSLNRTTPQTASGGKGTAAANNAAGGDPPLTPVDVERTASSAHADSPQPIPPTSSVPSSHAIKRRASDTASAVVDGGDTAGGSRSSVKSGNNNNSNNSYKASPAPPRELSSLSRRESVASASAPPAAALSLPSPSSKSTKRVDDATSAAGAVTSTSLGPLRDSTRVNSGNNNSNKSNSEGSEQQKTKKANADGATAPGSRRDSALPSTTHRSPQVSPAAEGASPSVTLPRVSSQLPVHRVASQLSSTNSQRASGTPAPSSVDSAGAELMRGTSPAVPPLPTSASSSRLQPHPPSTTTLHRTSSTSSTGPSAPSLTAVKEEKATQQASRHTSQLKSSTTSGKSNTASSGKTSRGLLLPAVVNIFSSPTSLRNFGATCYLNSVVQCLLATPGLLRTLDKDRQRIITEWEGKKGNKFDESHRRSCAERNAPATSALLDLGTAKPKQETPTPQLLLSLKAACGECNEEFAGNGQNDAHEFLITLLGVIDQEVCRSKPEAYQTMKDVEDECKRDAYARWTERLRRENDSTIYDYFGGVTGSTVQCATCGLISYRFEAQLDISLPMAYNSGPRAVAGSGANEGKDGKARPEEVVAVDLLLHDMFFSDRGEYLSGPMQVTCDRCKKLRDKTIWSTIEQWPPILVLHLKRFNNAGVKNESAVIFPYTFCPFGRVKYHLYGVCCHRGTASFGHYTSYVYTDGDATTVQLPQRPAAAASASVAHNGDRAEGSMEVFRSPPSCSFARSVEDDFDFGEECDLPSGMNVTQVKTHGGGGGAGGGKDGSSGNGGASKAGKWYFCNDETITTVSASEVVSKTKDAYILFYRRVA